MRLCTSALLLSLLATGCMDREGDPADDVATTEQGLTEVRIDARALLDAGITQVTLESGGQSEALELNPATGTYDGAIILPAGPQSVVARAFAGSTLVGASNPTNVDVQAGQVTRIMMRILDVTGSAAPLYGPILDSLVYPTTAQAMVPVSLTASVVAPAGDPVTYEWSDSCPDSTFSAPASATTSWSKAAQGPCTITLLATSNGFSIAQSFEVVVFPPGSASGAVDASATFIGKPSLILAFPEAGCYLSAGGNASCPVTIASPNVTSYDVGIMSWGGSSPGSITLSDSCGGRFGTSNNYPEHRTGAWLPPVGAGVCILTATAVNGDGIAATLSAAVLVRAGTPPTAEPPAISGQAMPGSNCSLDSSSPAPSDCGAIPAGARVHLYGSIAWANGTPGSVTLLDDCDGGLIPPYDAFYFSSPWNLPSTPGRTCTMTVRATNLQGGTSEASLRYQLL